MRSSFLLRWSRLGDLQQLCVNGEYKRATEAFELRFPPTPASAGLIASVTGKAAPASSSPSSSSPSSSVLTAPRFATTFRHDSRDVALLLMRAYASQGKMEGVRRVFDTCVEQLRPLGAPVIDAYLEALTKRNNFSQQDVVNVMALMESGAGAGPVASSAEAAAVAGAPIAKSPLTYLYLIEMHVRMGKDPVALWNEMLGRSDAEVLLHCANSTNNGSYGAAGAAEEVAPLAASVVSPRLVEPLFAASKLLLHNVVPHSKDAAFGFSVASTAFATGRVDRQAMADLFAVWSAADEVSPEQCLWLLLQLELRCVYEQSPLMHMVQKTHLAALLLRCAKCGDSATAERVLGLAERHLTPKTADLLALMVWCYTQAEQTDKAFDTLELMARKGFLTNVDPFKRYVVEGLSFTMERHFLMALADALSSKALVDKAYYHMEARHRKGQSVSAHSLDVIVLACSKIGDENRATETLQSYAALGAQPRTNSYNCLLLAATGKRKVGFHRTVFEAMVRDGIQPNSYTFKLLIRQSILNENVAEAIEFLQMVPTFGARTEVEFILPILERAARAGDLDTVYRMCKYALDSDVGIDSVVLGHVVKHLREHGCDTAAVQEMVPLHDQLRSRSKSARKRVRHEVPAATVTGTD